MQSDGGLTSMDKFIGSRAILSGPAGGVVSHMTYLIFGMSSLQVGYALTTILEGEDRRPVIGFDMGGTSTDVSRYDNEYEHVFESITAGISIQAPQVSLVH